MVRRRSCKGNAFGTASPFPAMLPRRRVFKAAWGFAALAAAAFCLADGAFATPNAVFAAPGALGGAGGKSALDLPITNLTLQRVQVYDVIKALQYQYQVPVCFIDASAKTEDSRFDPARPTATYQLIAVGHPLFTIGVRSGTVRDALNQLVAQDPAYRYGLVAGRLIVYPAQAKFEAIVSGVRIHRKPRGEAAVDYVFGTLGKRVKGFEDYGTAIGRYGEGPDAPLYMVPVTLASSGTVLEQMAELLGSEANVVFFVSRTSSGTNLFQFDTVGPQPPRVPMSLVLPEADNQQGRSAGTDIGPHLRAR